MPSMNRVTLIGHLGKDPELRYTQGGKAVVSFSLATSEQWTDSAGQKQERTEWHQVQAWDRLAEAVGKSIAKGSLVYVDGTLKSREYEKDGIKRRVWEVNAFKILFLSRPGGNGQAKQAATAGYAPSDEAFPSDGDDSDIPF